MKVAILAGGYGTRISEETEIRPKLQAIEAEAAKALDIIERAAQETVETMRAKAQKRLKAIKK